jgi:hypothetical protein
MKSRSNALDTAIAVLPYALPVLGGLLGVVWVNLNKMEFLNPVLWIGIGVVAGWVLARVLVRLLGRL